ncbi:phage virion morphogenesis protein [Ahrensia sp. R2A130]|uniref:phage virion morphogenesis protein n=1 Tax=Ahrensia sp. R2A130 TaxID=744979 RepID=UPI0001E0B516|nr:phage virion morphogenesis protein [Ahrensia sp. R2A130]EFL88292.1 phage virion morphogenesis protein [Ahrensia sp. R2A130]
MITIELVGLDAAIKSMSAVLGWKEPALNAAAAAVENQTVKRIVATKTAPDGSKWSPLADSTVASKGTDNILVDTGGLAGSIQRTVGGDIAIVGTNLAYAGYLQGGTKKMPARPFIGISASDEQEVRRVFESVVRRLAA